MLSLQVKCFDFQMGLLFKTKRHVKEVTPLAHLVTTPEFQRIQYSQQMNADYKKTFSFASNYLYFYLPLSSSCLKLQRKKVSFCFSKLSSSFKFFVIFPCFFYLGVNWRNCGSYNNQQWCSCDDLKTFAIEDSGLQD